MRIADCGSRIKFILFILVIFVLVLVLVLVIVLEDFCNSINHCKPPAASVSY
jgi:hypothetical protein